VFGGSWKKGRGRGSESLFTNQFTTFFREWDLLSFHVAFPIIVTTGTAAQVAALLTIVLHPVSEDTW